MNKKISLIVFIVIAIAMNLIYFNDTTDFSADFGLVALAQFPGEGPGEHDDIGDNIGYPPGTPPSEFGMGSHYCQEAQITIMICFPTGSACPVSSQGNCS